MLFLFLWGYLFRGIVYRHTFSILSFGNGGIFSEPFHHITMSVFASCDCRMFAYRVILDFRSSHPLVLPHHKYRVHIISKMHRVANVTIQSIIVCCHNLSSFPFYPFITQVSALLGSHAREKFSVRVLVVILERGCSFSV